MKKVINTNYFKEVTVSVEVAMPYYYKSFLEAIKIEANDDTNQFLSGVQCVVWGSLYVEAVVNRTAARIFRGLPEPNTKVKQLIWELSERSDLEKKVEALAKITDCDEAVSGKHRNHLSRLVRLRNRLVHYKEPPMPVDASFMRKTSLEILGLKEMPPEGITRGQVDDWLSENLPNPHIVSAVLSMSLDERRCEIIAIAGWIESMQVTYRNSVP